jgi:hypothetical protein
MPPPKMQRFESILTAIDRSRPGLRVARRRHAKSRVGHSHKISTADTIKWFKAKYDATVR